MVKISTLKRQLLLAISLAGLTACASYTPQQVDQLLSEYRGMSLTQLITAWGVPSKQFSTDKQTFVEWRSVDSGGQSSVSIGSASAGSGSFLGLGVTIPIDSPDDECTRRATLSEDKQTVTLLIWRGDADYCGELLAALKKDSDTSQANQEQ